MTARDYMDTGSYEVVDLGTGSNDAEAIALRMIVQRLRDDNDNLRRSLTRVTEESEQWRTAYYRALREKAEWTTKTTTPAPRGPTTN